MSLSVFTLAEAAEPKALAQTCNTTQWLRTIGSWRHCCSKCFIVHIKNDVEINA